MPEPSLHSGVTTRRGLRGASNSPKTTAECGSGGVSVGRSPRARSARTATHNLSGDRGGSSDEYSDDDGVVSEGDEVDRTTTHGHSPQLYPDLPESFGHSPTRSPGIKSSVASPAETVDTSRSSCHSRTGPRAVRNPVTRSPDSPRNRLYPNLPEDNTRHNTRGATPVMLIFIATVVIVAILILCLTVTNNEELKPKQVARIKPIDEVYSDLKMSLKALNHETSQPREFWVQLLGQLGSIMVKKPGQPAVILVVVPQDSRATAACLIHSVARAIKEAFEDTKFTMFDVRSGSLYESAQLKVELDNSLKGLESAHAAVVHNIELVPGHTAMIFHAYCDNENAPYKQALILPMMEIPVDYNTAAHTRLDDYVAEQLTKLWGVQLREKDVSAIISRIANAPVLIKPETPDTIRALCSKV